jgi:hypothetical protein
VYGTERNTPNLQQWCIPLHFIHPTGLPHKSNRIAIVYFKEQALASEIKMG